MRRMTSSVAFLVLLSACNQGGPSVHIPAAFDVMHLTNIMKAPESISKEAVAQIAGTNSDKIKIYNEDFSADLSKRTILFSWPNGNKKSVKIAAGKELSVNEYSSMGLGFVTKISKEYFQKKFEGKVFIQDEINRITKDEAIDADLAIMEARHLAETAKTQQFEKIENVGEMAYWETPINALHIFVKGISLTITTNLADNEISREKAIALTQLIFNSPVKPSK
jgi:hypothetical protein